MWRRSTWQWQGYRKIDHFFAVRGCIDALKQPIRYAGESEYTVFEQPRMARDLSPSVVTVPGTQLSDLCLVVSGELWSSFLSLSLWIEALAVHKWCLFIERILKERAEQGAPLRINRGDVYFLLTDRPDNRRPLTWERNRIEILLMEGTSFTCPWTRKKLSMGSDFDIDHLLPFAVYPVNELWNLLPTDREFNQRVKRDRIPKTEALQPSEVLIADAYGNYQQQENLHQAVREDAALRFSGLPAGADFPARLAARAIRFIEEVAVARSVDRF